MVTKLNNTKIEDLLNEMYNQVDLKDSVFEYVQPYVLEAYALLKKDSMSIQQSAKSILGVENKHELEKILYTDLPDLIDIYSKMPLEYRNEHRLKTGQTHRQLLLENVQILSDTINKLVKINYDDVDQQMSVKNRFFKEKYVEPTSKVNLGSSSVEYEKERIASSDSFNWNSVKSKFVKAKPVNPKDLMDRDFVKEPVVNSHKIVLREDTIEYKVKDKFRHFMAGTYDAYVKAKESIKQYRKDFKKKSKKFFNSSFGIFVTVMGIVGGIGGAVIGSGFSIVYLIEKDKFPGKELVKGVDLISSASVQGGSYKDVAISALNKYSKEHGINVQYLPDGVVLSKNESKDECIKGVDIFNYSSIGEYTINDKLFSSHYPVPEIMAEDVCKLKENVVVIKKAYK
jgi:hypothetical protein